MSDHASRVPWHPLWGARERSRGQRLTPVLPYRHRRLLWAVYGACWGCLSALMLVHLLFHLWHGRVHKTNVYFFLSSLALGTAGAFLAARSCNAGRRWSVLASLGMVAWLPLFNWAIQVTLNAQRTNQWVFWPGCLAGAGLVLIWLLSTPLLGNALRARHGR
jgi:hypothetical protein